MPKDEVKRPNKTKPPDREKVRKGLPRRLRNLAMRLRRNDRYDMPISAACDRMEDAADLIDEQHDWLYAIWMAFLADEETHDLQYVLRNMSTWMAKQEEGKDA